MNINLQITSYNGKAAYEKEGPDQLYIYFFTSTVSPLTPGPGNTYRRGRLSTVDLLIRVARFGKKVNNVFNGKSS